MRASHTSLITRSAWCLHTDIRSVPTGSSCTQMERDDMANNNQNERGSSNQTREAGGSNREEGGSQRQAGGANREEGGNQRQAGGSSREEGDSQRQAGGSN